MLLLRKLFLGTLALVLGVMVGSLFLPASYELTRSITIKAPIGLIFQHVNNLPLNALWSPWQEDDPTMRVRYSAQKEGEGAVLFWTSAESGDGHMTITKSVAPYRIDTHLDFEEQGQAKAWWTFAEQGDGVIVTWGLSGDAGYNPIARVMGLLMDKLVGSDYEQGLSKLKEVVEQVGS